MNARRVTAIARKEWREILRDRLFFTLAFVVPVLLMLLLGFGLTLDVEHLPLAVFDFDHTVASRNFGDHFRSSRYFDVIVEGNDERGIAELLMANRVRAVVVIPPHFGQDLNAGRAAHVQTLIDGSLPFRTQMVKGYVSALAAAATSELAGGSMPSVRIDVRYRYNESVRSVVSFGPKLLMMILFMCAPFLTALGVVRERESGAIYNIYSSTATRGDFLLGKLLPYAGIALVNGAVLWLMAVLLLGAPFRGSPVFLAVATGVYILCATGIGLLVSLLVRTQVASMFVTAIVTMIPAQLYSGALVPLPSMKAAGRAIARALPALYYHEIVVGTFLKGTGLAELWPRLVLLAGYALALWVLALMLFTKRPRA